MIIARRAVGILAFCAVFAVILFTNSPRASAEPEALLGLAGCTDNTFERLFPDQARFAELGFEIALADGGVVEDLVINENGAVSFRFGLDYSRVSSTLDDLARADNELIAPLWADVDLAEGGSITYGQDTYQGRPAFCVNWTDVVPRIDEKSLDPAIDIANLPTNTFQLILIERADRATGDFDIMFNYSDIEWDDSAEPCNDVIPVAAQAEIAAEAPSEAAFPDECCNFGDDEFCCAPNDFSCCIELEICVPPGAADAAAAPVFIDGVPGLAGYAFPTIASPNVLALPGSGLVDAMIGPNGLAQRSTNSIVPGRHIFSIESDRFSQGSTVFGIVSEFETGETLEGARVSVCTSDNRCASTSSGADGSYAIAGVPNGLDNTLWVSSPPGGSYRSVTYDISILGDTLVSVGLVGPEPLVPGISIQPSRNSNSGTPSVYYGASFEITAEGCAGGTATYSITGRNADRTGTLTYSDGLYRATVSPLRPNSGDAIVTITIVCPDGAEPEGYGFPIYIDPAGLVLDSYSGDVIEGATVTLYTAELEIGPYTIVADGDASIMDPSINDSNPSVTLADGRFRWDTSTGWYYVAATKDGCEQVVAVDEDDPSSRSINLFVPPEVTDLELLLDCNNPPEVSGDGETLEANTLGGYAGPLAEPSVFDHDDNFVSLDNDAPALLPVGDTSVTWTATDSDGASGTGVILATIIDSTPPVITASDVEVTVAAAPAPVSFTPTAVDIVDGDVAVTCDPASGSMFDAGVTEVSCTATDAAGNTSEAATFIVAVTVDDTPPACGGLAIEGETGELSGTMSLAAGGTAAGFADGPNNYTFDAANVAEYCVTTEEGLYRIDGLVSAPATNADSFWVSIDGGEPVLWHIPATDGFESRQVSAAGVPSARPKLWDLDAGEHTVQFFVRESGTLLDSFELVLVGDSPPPPPPECAGLVQEAEDAALAGSMTVAKGSGASGDLYVVAPAGSGRFYTMNSESYVEFCVNVEIAGEYRIDARTQAPDFRRDSFYVEVDDGDIFPWHVRQSGIFVDRTVFDGASPATFDLDVGEHTVRFYLREEQTRLDSVELVSLAG